MENTLNYLTTHADMQHVTIIAEVQMFGHTFKRIKPMDFVVCDKHDPEIHAYLEIGEHCALHENEPMFHVLHGYQSDGITIPLIAQEQHLPPGIYALRAESNKKSGE